MGAQRARVRAVPTPGPGVAAAPRRPPAARLPLACHAAAGGVLYALGYVGWGVWPLICGFLVPLWIALEASRGRSLAAAFRLGIVFGVAAYVAGFSWLWRLTDAFLGGDRLAGAVLFGGHGAWFALPFGVYAAVFVALRRRGRGLALAGVAPLLAVEWLPPQLFPLFAGGALVQVPVAAQTADLGGPLLLSALVGGANLAAYEAWRWLRGQRPAPRATALATAAVAGVALVYGAVRVVALDAAIVAAPALRVGIVQANLGALEKRRQGIVAHRRHVEQTRELLAGGGVDLVVWPETAYVRGLRRPLPISGTFVRDGIDVPLLFGGSSVFEEGGRRVRANSAFLVGADGVIRDVYDKNLLIPLAEYVPLVSAVPALAAWFPHASGFHAATDVPPLRLGPWRIATPICYEAVRPDFVRRLVREARPQLLVTLANDAWFGDSQEPWLHLAMARLRALEHRRFLVRATNSGVSAVIDPAGRVLVQSGVLTRESLRAVVHALDRDTVYARLGDWPGWLATALVVLGLLTGPSRAGRGTAT